MGSDWNRTGGACVRGMMRAMLEGAKVAIRKPVTVHYPDEKRQLPKRARTFPYLIWNHALEEANCTGCGKCAKACPVDCMTTVLEKNALFAEGGSNHKSVIKDFYIDFGRCMRCNICVEVCPFDAIAMLPQWEGHEQSKFDRRELVMDLDDLLAPSRADAALPFWIPETVLELTQKERAGRAAFIADQDSAGEPALKS
jgi:formate hydrogenlyase subunit 6/NADH:ubiquinone oxidoreductase subunit I